MLEDTPECTVEEYDTNNDGLVYPEECVGAGADNFLLYASDGLEMTADQAWVLRRFPLFYSLE